jgi:hypothetical protein
MTVGDNRDNVISLRRWCRQKGRSIARNRPVHGESAKVINIGHWRHLRALKARGWTLEKAIRQRRGSA